jgi:GT2 family glycosyltransferase
MLGIHTQLAMGAGSEISPPRANSTLLETARHRATPAVDVVVCVHNALHETHACLSSLLRRTARSFRLIVVDDASGEETARYLHRFASTNPTVTLIRIPQRRGYTIAANAGLRESTGDFVVLLNSDTRVSVGWLDGLLECLRGQDSIGIVGPLSNAATIQSVPRVRAETSWAVNELPSWLTEDGLAFALACYNGPSYVVSPLINGFCFGINREVIRRIGLFDEVNYPDGYGEESDYVLRAHAAGFGSAIATKTYVYHAKSRSYGAEHRLRLAKRNHARLLERHGSEVETLVRSVEFDETLASLRNWVDGVTSSPEAFAQSLPPVAPLFVLPSFPEGGSGGGHSIYQEVIGMRQLGISARIAVPKHHWPRVTWAYDNLEPFVPFNTDRDLARELPQSNVVVATHHRTVPIVATLVGANTHLSAGYYIQDYEPFFHGPGSREASEAEASYVAMPDALLFAKTDWLCDVVSRTHGVHVWRVEPSLDTALFHSRGRRPIAKPIRLVAMVRPRTPRRAAPETSEVLDRLIAELGDMIEVHTFGCSDRELAKLRPNSSIVHHGILRRGAVAELFRRCDIFIDASPYQAFGRTGLEAMACGVAVVMPRVGGAAEFVTDSATGFLVDTSDVAAVAHKVSMLAQDRATLRRIQNAAAASALYYSIPRAAVSELVLFARIRRARSASSQERATVE